MTVTSYATACRASAYGAAVRQRTVRQETTMAKHGTLPEYLYQRHFKVGDKVNLNFGVDEDEGPYGGPFWSKLIY